MTFTIPDRDDPISPWPIFERLLQTHEELGELAGMLDSGITLAFMLRHGEWKRGPVQRLGTCYCGPSVQGDLRPLFDQLLEDTLGYSPDFLIVLAGDWWADATERERTVLVFHEALHAGQARDEYGTPKFNRRTGLPVTCINPHSIEEFTAVVKRYGAWKSDLAEFLEAAAESPLPVPSAGVTDDVF